MARIGIVQVDGKIPNLALMKICTYHEKLGDKVEFWKGSLWNNTYDKIYVSKIFSFSKTPNVPSNAIIGGTGIDFKNNLPIEIEDCRPSYSLYPNCNCHIGFSMKGCRFACKFCVVPQKEGRPRHISNIDDLLKNPKGGNRLMLLDNDFFGSPNWNEDLNKIIDLKLKICFVQGLNIRIITSEQAELLSKCKYTNSKFNQRYLTFAWDKFNDKKSIEKGISICNKAGIPCKKMQFFVLIGYKTTHEQDIERVMILKEKGCKPFVMPYNKDNPYQKAFARWVNNRAVFNSCSWENYKYNR